MNNGNIDLIQNNIDLIISNQAWWNIEYDIGLDSIAKNVPHVTIEHGAPFFYQGGKQYYRKNIGAASVKFLWGKYNLEIMKKYGCSENLMKVTGFPRFDSLKNFSSTTNSIPRILFLSTWKIPGKIKEIWERTVLQAKSLGFNLAIKHHPQEKHRGYQIQSFEIPDWVEVINNENLFEEVAKSDLVITSPTSVLIPAIYYNKPIYCYYSVFTKNYYKGLVEFYLKFNFLSKPNFYKKFDIENLLNITIDKEKYNKIFNYVAHSDDGNNSYRVYKECLKIIE